MEQILKKMELDNVSIAGPVFVKYAWNMEKAQKIIVGYLGLVGVAPEFWKVFHAIPVLSLFFWSLKFFYLFMEF